MKEIRDKFWKVGVFTVTSLIIIFSPSIWFLYPLTSIDFFLNFQKFES